MLTAKSLITMREFLRAQFIRIAPDGDHLMDRWEASVALRKRLVEAGYDLQGAPAGWSEIIRVFRQCKVSSRWKMCRQEAYVRHFCLLSSSKIRATWYSTRIPVV